MYQFLENFHLRMEQVAIHQFLNEKASIREGLRLNAFTESEALNLYMELLCFIMEKSLLEQSCTLEDMEAFVVYILNKENDNIDRKEAIDYEGLTRYLVRDALQNKGKPYYFDTYNFKEKKLIQIHVRLIEDKILQIDHQDVFSYHLTSQGYEFLFGTLEVEESLQMSFEQLKLQYAIKKRNFSSARDSADNLFTLNRKQIQKIREYIVQIKEDIGVFSTLDYQETYASTFETLNEQKEKHEELYGLISRTKEQYTIQYLGKEHHEKMEEDLTNIDYIKNRLQQLVGEQLKLFGEQQTLGQVYDEAISNVLYIGFENRLNIEKTILEPFERDVMALDGMTKLLRPLMKPQLGNRFNFAKAYANQKIESENEQIQDDGYYLEKGEDEFIEKVKERIDYIQECYKDIVKQLLNKISKSNQYRIKLSEIYDGNQDIELLRNVLVQLHSDGVFDLKALGKDSLEHIYEPGEDFDLGYSYVKCLSEESHLSRISWLECSRVQGETIVLINDKDKKYLKCHELVFLGKKKGE